MSRVPRFFVPDLPALGEFSLPLGEERHARRVLRLQPGDPLELFDGKGRSVSAVVTRAGDAIQVRIEEPPRAGTQSTAEGRIALAFAIPKPKPCAWLLQKCCEAGVDELLPLLSERSLFPRAAPG